MLEQVIEDQQNLIHTHAGHTDVLQTFIPYKEVMLLYDEGLKVPEDIEKIANSKKAKHYI